VSLPAVHLWPYPHSSAAWFLVCFSARILYVYLLAFFLHAKMFVTCMPLYLSAGPLCFVCN
jgi:hypothetical protein